MTLVERAAVVLAVAYLVLAIRESRWCWPAGFGSSLLYLAVYYQSGLYMQSALQLFYAGIAVYGWWAWQPQPGGGAALAIHRWPLHWHALAAVAIAVLTLGSGWLLAHYRDAALPYQDSFVTWSAVLATGMVARKLLENWLYWFVVDAMTLGLVLERGLYPTAALFALYLVLVVIGWQRWLASWRKLAKEES
jgi:nicotinamide mononucleotide transporter